MARVDTNFRGTWPEEWSQNWENFWVQKSAQDPMPPGLLTKERFKSQLVEILGAKNGPNIGVRKGPRFIEQPWILMEKIG